MEIANPSECRKNVGSYFTSTVDLILAKYFGAFWVLSYPIWNKAGITALAT